MLRRRMPIAKLKTEMFSIGYLSKTKIVMIYVEGLTNPEFISTTRSKLSNIDFDLILESSNVTAFMDDHTHSVFPQYMQTDRPDACAYSLGLGKLIILVDNTPFAIIAPITFFSSFSIPRGLYQPLDGGQLFSVHPIFELFSSHHIDPALCGAIYPSLSDAAAANSFRSAGVQK